MLGQERPRPHGLRLVLRAHGLQGRRVVVLQPQHHVVPVPRRGQLGHLGLELGVRGDSPLVQLRRAVAQDLLVAQQRGVQLLAHPPVTGGALGEVLQERRQLVERGRGGLGGLGQPRPQVGVDDLRGQRPGEERPTGPGLADGAPDDDRRRQRRVQVRPARGEHGRHLGQPHHDRVHQLRLRAQPVQERGEQREQHRGQVGRRVAPPRGPGGSRALSAQHGDEQVAVDRLLQVEAVGGHRLEPGEPFARLALLRGEPVGAEVAERPVVLQRAQHGGMTRRTVEVPREHTVDQAGQCLVIGHVREATPRRVSAPSPARSYRRVLELGRG